MPDIPELGGKTRGSRSVKDMKYCSFVKGEEAEYISWLTGEGEGGSSEKALWGKRVARDSKPKL